MSPLLSNSQMCVAAITSWEILSHELPAAKLMPILASSLLGTVSIPYPGVHVLLFPYTSMLEIWLNYY